MIRRLMKSIREYRKNAILAPVSVSMEVVMEVLIPMLMAAMVDQGIEKGDMSVIIRMGLFLAVAAFLSLFFGLFGLLTVLLLLLHFLELDLVLLFLHLLSFRWRNDLNLQVQAFPHHFISFQLLHCIPCGIWFLDWIWFNPAKFKSFI